MGKARQAWQRATPFFGATLALLVAQATLAFCGVGELWTRGHNGFNSSAYFNAARNSWRWDLLFPLQYDTSTIEPAATAVYTHAPLGMHLHGVLSVGLFGEHEWALRLVPAIYAVFVLTALIYVTTEYWGKRVGLLAGLIYLLLPINTIYLNMINHSCGFIIFGLLELHFYLRLIQRRDNHRRHFVSLLLCHGVAAMWDWPACFVAALIGLHWISHAFFQQRIPKEQRHRLKWVGFCTWVLAVFFAHFALVAWTVGGLAELKNTFGARLGVSWGAFAKHLSVVPEIMFTNSVLVLCCLWLLFFAYRTLRMRSTAKDLIPLSFAIGGITYYIVFKQSAVVHSYWAWTCLPFVATAIAISVNAVTTRLQAKLALGHDAGTLLFCAVAIAAVSPLATRTIELTPAARKAGGSMWFVSPVRGNIQNYSSGRNDLRFVHQVRRWTDRSTGVLMHNSFRGLVGESRLPITLNREWRWSYGTRPPPIPKRKGPRQSKVKGWVLIGKLKAVDRKERLRLAAEHPYKEFDTFFMVDFRSQKPSVQIFKSTPASPSWASRFLISPYEEPLKATLDQKATQRMAKEVAAAAKAARSAEDNAPKETTQKGTN